MENKHFFINLSNHPSSGWSEEQLAAARCYGDIIDLSFPNIDEKADEDEIMCLADEYLKTILGKGAPQNITVHIMGEQSFCYALISLLQKNGISCVASCTKRDTYVNEKGETVHPFHFFQFREYVPFRNLAICGWLKFYVQRFREHFSHWAFLYRKEFYSWIALALVLLCELFVIVFLQTEFAALKTLAFILAGLIPLLGMVGWFFRQRFFFRSAIVTKLLANAVAPSTLGTLYLITFVVHVGWLTNAVLGLYTASGDAFCNVFLSTMICVAGIVVLIIFFPKGSESKVETPKKIIISGISEIKKPFDGNYSKLNLRPLVRILEKEKTLANCELVILRSDYNNMSDSDLAKNIKDVLAFVLESRKKQESENIRPVQIEEEVAGLLNGKDIKQQLETLIKQVAICDYPDREEEIGSLRISWTEKCDYNDFKSCFDALAKRVEGKDDRHHRLVCYVSPGTAMVGSVLTLMAIDGDRELLYYSQDNHLPDSKRLKTINKNEVPIKNLLSQALETLEEK